MVVIGLFGSSHSGKTTTLNQVIEQLKSVGKEIDSQKGSTSKDQLCCVRYQGKKICIATGGDTCPILKDNCAFFDKHKPDIAISATRTKGATCEVLNRYAAKKGSEVIWLEKLTYTIYESNEKDNEENGELIYRELNNIDTFRILKVINSKNVKIKKSFEFHLS
ncbi:hypothetical protein PL75_08765 [Neisseria arctica]|uniref:Uncharacterized protein n=1 Tax=Neisseria arctica TaxID=1470200 RepID=A0A0J0YQD9_9NEIS|nr:hypothetical protein [Neisseria arctica]KLT72344.1 hypothetical protein PL75_08765 [Neisseria arctica]UOO85951.1 hypothetical protein LVJ86_06860 [Neisseria arctica]